MNQVQTQSMPLILTDDYFLEQYGVKKKQYEIIKNTYCKGVSEDEVTVFFHICKHLKLDPMLKQVYAIPRSGKMTVQTSIDGYRAIAERTGKYSPGREAVYSYDKNGKILSCTSFVKKMTPDGTWHEIGATAFFSEYEVKGTFWNKMPHVMIAKCAESLALRKAFPEQLSAIRTEDEMEQASKPRLEQEPQLQHIEEIKFMDDIKINDLNFSMSQPGHDFFTNMNKYIEKEWGCVENMNEENYEKVKNWCEIGVKRCQL